MKIKIVSLLIALLVATSIFSQSSKFEAEEMIVISGSTVYIFDTCIGIYDNGGVQFFKSLNDGIYEVSVKARETRAGDKHAQLLVENNKGVSIEFEIKSLVDSVYIDTLVIDNGNVWKLLFTNDFYVPDVGDRNLFIDYINFTCIVSPPPPPPSPPDTTMVRQDSVRVSWDPNLEADLASYKVYYGIKSRLYSKNIGHIIDTTIIILDSFIIDIPYYFAVTARDTANNESNYSNEVTYLFKSVAQDDKTAPNPPNLTVTPIIDE